MKPKIYTPTEHRIPLDRIDTDALYVLEKLREAGHEAYIVGGGVRDLILGREPKDFDISTSARPEQIKRIFYKNCLLIGRRFRLAHVRFGRKIFEVSTFRTGDTGTSQLITRDNKWGTAEEDVTRRDFTINGLCYDSKNESVIDYVGGCEDIHLRLLRAIGEPVLRFKQDPVRMIRLIKFMARFGFDVDPDTLNALASCRDEIVKSSPARVMEEIFRMLESGAAEPFFRLMCEHGLLEPLIPGLHSFLCGPHAEEVYALLKHVDEAIGSGQQAPDRSILAAVLLYPILEHEMDAHFYAHDIVPNLDQIFHLVSQVIEAVYIAAFTHFPQRMQAGAHYILSMQYRLTPKAKTRRQAPPKIANHREFNLALKLLELRAKVNDELEEAYQTWKELAPPPETVTKKPRSRQRGRRHASRKS